MAKRRVLIVDDDPNLREMVSLILNDGQYVVEGAETGRAGLEHVA